MRKVKVKSKHKKVWRIWTHHYYDQHHPSVVQALFHIDLEQRLNLVLTSCDLEYPEGLQNPIPSSFHFPPSSEEQALDIFSANDNWHKKYVRTDQTPPSYVSTDEQYELLSITFTRCAIGSPHLNLSFSILSSSGSSLKENRSKCSIRDRKKSWHKPGRVDTNHEELLVTLHSFQ